MPGKLTFLVAICATLIQVRGVEDFIKGGLDRAEGLNENGLKRIVDALNEVVATRDVIEKESVEFVTKSARVQSGVRETLRREAEAMEEKARETQKPDSAFQCIRVAEENANNRVEYLTNKFKTDIERLEEVKLANIETASEPLNGMQESLRVRHERAAKQVKGCGGFGCVDTAVGSFESWLHLLIADIERILERVGKVYSNFDFDANNYFDNSFKQIDAIKSSTARNIKQCV